jgi:tetratricopeptide (TPR) repeat protein
MDSANLLFPLLFILFTYALTLTGKGDYDEALATFQEGLALSEKVGNEVLRHRFLNSLGWLHMELMDLDRALDLNREGADGARTRGDPETIANAELNLGDIFLAKGDFTLAQEHFDGVDRLVKNPATSDWMKWRYTTHLFSSLGELWLARRDPVKAREFAEQCLELAKRTDSRKYLIKGYRLKGEIALLIRHQWDEAERMLGQGLRIAEAIGNPTQLWKTHLALGQLYTETKNVGAARGAYRAARDVIDRMKANLRNPELHSSLENSPLVRHIYEV